MALCPEAESRAAMSDAEFWEHVLQPGQLADYEPDDPDADELSERDIERRIATPCPECGQYGACAYDADGRALIHVTESED